MLIVTVNVLKLAKEDALVLVSALLTSLIKPIGSKILAVYVHIHEICWSVVFVGFVCLFCIIFV